MACVHLKDCVIAQGYAYKDECTKCFDTDSTSGGLDICVSCFNGGCAGDLNHSYNHFMCGGMSHAIVCNIKRKKVIKEVDQAEKVTKVAIGVAGGVSAEENYTYNVEMVVRCLECKISFDNSAAKVEQIIGVISRADSYSKAQSIATWENKLEMCEHTLCLVQDPSKALATKLVVALAKCQSCEISESLWLCFTCGALGCSRKNFDGTGGNGHAVEHFKTTGHPVVCKMGTITPEGSADVYCYDCDDMKLDGDLISHLSHFGIQTSSQVKTAKSMAEMDLELNLNFDWSSVYEAGKLLPLVFGPQRTGLENLGNSCYVASVLQCIFALPAFMERYYVQGKDHLKNCSSLKPAECFSCQMAKVACALNDGRYSSEPKEYLEWNRGKQNDIETEQTESDRISKMLKEQEETNKLSKDWQPGVPPRMLKTLIAGQHSEFKSTKQQDAFEYFQHFVSEVQRKERVNGIQQDPTNCFSFEMETRLECTNCHRVRYTTTPCTNLSLRIPCNEEALVSKTVESERVDFTACLQVFAAEVQLENYNCSQCAKRTLAIQHSRFKSFPEVLVVQMLKFVSPHWVPVKLNVSISVLDKIDLESLRSKGMQPNELSMPGDSLNSQANNKLVANADHVASLMDMGFTKNACTRAVLAVKNSGIEEASTWLFNHIEDLDVNNPIEEIESQNVASSSFDEMAVVQICSMGFSEDRVKYALKETNGDADRAVDWLFSHADDPLPVSISASASLSSVSNDNSPAHYSLGSFITHLGSSTGCGHYVSHVLRDNDWIYFNDAKVSSCPELPKDQAYVYFFTKSK